MRGTFLRVPIVRIIVYGGPKLGVSSYGKDYSILGSLLGSPNLGKLP